MVSIRSQNKLTNPEVMSITKHFQIFKFKSALPDFSISDTKTLLL